MSKIIGSVLVVDDDTTIVKILQRALSSAGYTVTTRSDGKQALDLCQQQSFDLVISDVQMPGLNGIQLLKQLRATDPDVPVILVAGDPELNTVMNAVKYGALRFIPKPIDLDELNDAVAFGMQVHRLARLKREALALLGENDKRASDLAGLEQDFDCSMMSLWMAYQPIVSCGRQTVVGYEALMRSVEPALPHPGAILDAAERLGRLRDLGGKIRDVVARQMKDLTTDFRVFVNLHADDLGDDSLYSTLAPLSRESSRVVLEITERVDLERVKGLQDRVAELRKLGFRLAIDDLGSGYAGLSSFIWLKPDIVKIDMSLVRDIDTDPGRQKLVASLIELSHDMGIENIIEGVETAAERDKLLELGGDLMQGFFFAKPGVAFPSASPECFSSTSIRKIRV